MNLPDIFAFQNYEIRSFLMLFAGFLTYLLIRFQKFNLRQIGMKSLPSKKSLASVLPVTFILILLLGLLKNYYPFLFDLRLHYRSPSSLIIRGLVYIILSVPLQEIIFRGILITFLEKYVSNHFLIVFIASLIFSAIHWPFNSPLFSLGTFILSLYISYNFIRYRNIYLSILIHSLLGIALMVYSL